MVGGQQWEEWGGGTGYRPPITVKIWIKKPLQHAQIRATLHGRHRHRHRFPNSTRMKSMNLVRIPLALTIATAITAGATAQTLRTEDPVLSAIWDEGMNRSQTETLAQALLDSIGPRLSGTAGFYSAADWIEANYREWGVEARQEQYGTWRGWERGILHVDLLAPRVRSLEATILAWSPGTDGPVEGEVVTVPEDLTQSNADIWLGTVRGKIVLVSAPQLKRLGALGGRQAMARLDEAGAIAVLSSRWSAGWGVNKVFSAGTDNAVGIDVSCEDYGLLARLAEKGQGPRVRINAEAELTGTEPMYNVIGEIRGTELPNEYVLLGAHLDSWHAASGATDNGTGTIMMLEAMRILKATYPSPKRTIIVGHWGGEELGLVGSGAFAQDHPEIVDSIQAAFNQDNGTWRIDYLQAQGFLGAGEFLARWIAQVPQEVAQHVELDLPGPQETGGSDHMSFICAGAPSFRLQSHYPDYRQYTWHTNRDTYDKIVFDDLKNNAVLAASLAYLAANDDDSVPRTRSVLPPGRNGTARDWAACRNPPREYR